MCKRKIICVVSFGLLLGLVLTNATNAADPNAADPNLVGWWMFDEGEGNKVLDSSGYGRDGTIKGGVTFVLGHGYVGYALEFQGKSTRVDVTGYVGISGTQSRTTAAWIKTAEDGDILVMGDSGTGEMWQFVIMDHVLRVEVGSQNNYIAGETDLYDNAWHHVAAVLDSNDTPNPTAGDIKLYVDGVLETVSGTPDVAINTKSGRKDIRIGRVYWQDIGNFGLLDDVRIYDRALTEEEIKDLALGKLRHSPREDAIVSPGDTELSWTLPDSLVPGQSVPVDVYFTDDYDALKMFSDPESIRIVSQKDVNSVIVKTQSNTKYYWAVDTYIGDPNDPIYSPIFSFVAGNLIPEVNAGADVVSWLEDGVRIRNLNGRVLDDGAIQPYTVQWTVISEPDDTNSPDAMIADATSENASITMSVVGDYVLQLDAFDGEHTGSNSLTIHVYADSCEAAKALPDYVPLVGDLNGDCKVDDLDMALLQENWLQDISLTEEVELD